MFNPPKLCKITTKTQLESWESLAISKARELELMEKVADNWQAKLIDQCKIRPKHTVSAFEKFDIRIWTIENVDVPGYSNYDNSLQYVDGIFLEAIYGGLDHLFASRNQTFHLS